MVVAAYVQHNSVPQAELVGLIERTHGALANLGNPPELPPAEKPVPAVPIKKSITPDWIISLEDGRKFKTLKRYLSTLGMTPDQYRAKWGLPSDYPMVAPSYAEARSNLARSMGLGRKANAPAQAAGRGARKVTAS